MKANYLLIPGVLLAATLAFSSCDRERVVFDGETYSSIENSFAEGEFTAIRNLIDTEGRADSNVYGKTTGTTGLYCPNAIVTVDILSSSSAEMTIDFGSGSNCLDGRLRTGKLIATFTGKWKDPGSTCTVVPQDYTVAGVALSFNKTITYNGENGQAQPNWTTEVTNAVATSATSGTFTWECTRVTTWVEGTGDLDASNNVFEVVGVANGVTRQNIAYDVVVDADAPLRVEASCPNIVSGRFSISPADRATRVIDYGTGACDNVATLTVGQYSGTITLR